MRTGLYFSRVLRFSSVTRPNAKTQSFLIGRLSANIQKPVTRATRCERLRHRSADIQNPVTRATRCGRLRHRTTYRLNNFDLRIGDCRHKHVGTSCVRNAAPTCAASAPTRGWRDELLKRISSRGSFGRRVASPSSARCSFAVLVRSSCRLARIMRCISRLVSISPS